MAINQIQWIKQILLTSLICISCCTAFAQLSNSSLQLSNDEITLPGRKISFNTSGFPEKIQTFFTPEMTGLSTKPNNIITEAIHFHVISSATHKDVKFKNKGIIYKVIKPGMIKWSALNIADPLKMEVGATIKNTGLLSYTVKITALEDVKLDDIKLHLPFTKEVSKYLRGLGNKGGNRPDSVKWKWDSAAKNENGAWIGEANAGLQYSLLRPSSWGNDGKGGILITEKGTSMLSENYSGDRAMKKGKVLYYNFTLLITPSSTNDVWNR